jgi:hypothetical protein
MALIVACGVSCAGILALSSIAGRVKDASANPMLRTALRGVQIPETRHVQVTMATMMSIPGMTSEGDYFVPAALVREGVPIPMHGPTAIEANTGSGVTMGQAYQGCDCNLPPGTYTYRFLPTGDSDPETWGMEIDVTVTEPPPRQPAPAPNPEVVEDGQLWPQPWNEPEPLWPQGFDCVAWCLQDTGAEDSGPEVVADDAQSSHSDGCSVGQGGERGSAWNPLLIMFLVLLSLARSGRRRRAVGRQAL